MLHFVNIVPPLVYISSFVFYFCSFFVPIAVHVHCLLHRNPGVEKMRGAKGTYHHHMMLRWQPSCCLYGCPCNVACIDPCRCNACSLPYHFMANNGQKYSQHYSRADILGYLPSPYPSPSRILTRYALKDFPGPCKLLYYLNIIHNVL